jgi:hypothetical protein
MGACHLCRHLKRGVRSGGGRTEAEPGRPQRRVVSIFSHRVTVGTFEVAIPEPRRLGNYAHQRVRQTTEFHCRFAATSMVQRRPDRCSVENVGSLRPTPKTKPFISARKADAIQQLCLDTDDERRLPKRPSIETQMTLRTILRSVCEVLNSSEARDGTGPVDEKLPRGGFGLSLLSYGLSRVARSPTTRRDNRRDRQTK